VATRKAISPTPAVRIMFLEAIGHPARWKVLKFA
jgi:hypothetical protein